MHVCFSHVSGSTPFALRCLNAMHVRLAHIDCNILICTSRARAHSFLCCCCGCFYFSRICFFRFVNFSFSFRSSFVGNVHDVWMWMFTRVFFGSTKTWARKGQSRTFTCMRHHDRIAYESIGSVCVCVLLNDVSLLLFRRFGHGSKYRGFCSRVHFSLSLFSPSLHFYLWRLRESRHSGTHYTRPKEFHPKI